MKPLAHLDKFRRKHPVGGLGDNYNGMFVLQHDGATLRVIASRGGGWDHVSVSLEARTPTWSEMSWIKDQFFHSDECVVQFHPPKSAYVNYHPHCLHMWRMTHQPMVCPPSSTVIEPT